VDSPDPGLYSGAEFADNQFDALAPRLMSGRIRPVLLG
jgi:hypothetical protein